MKSLRERIQEADERCSSYLADAAEAAERGDKAKAEKLYEKARYWGERYKDRVNYDPVKHERARVARKPLQERISDAHARSSRNLAAANEAAERGDKAKAKRLYEKGQFWLNRYRSLVGSQLEGDGISLRRRPAMKSLRERIIEADERGSRYLADANEAAERGDMEKAEKLYAKGQYWLDRYNKLVGNS